MYYVLWRTGALVPGHLFARRTSELLRPPTTRSLPPLPTIRFPPTTPTPSAAEASEPPFEAPDVPPASGTDLERLRARGLGMPLPDLDAGDLLDSFGDQRGSRLHEAFDVPAPRGTPVLAVDDGRVVKLFNSRAGGLTVYQFDPTETYCYYYAHLDRYAEGLKEGRILRRGDPIGAVGTTGNAPPETPHLHFAIFKLGPEKQWWRGAPINPYPIFAASK